MSTLSQNKTQRHFSERIPFTKNLTSNQPSPHNPNYQEEIWQKCPFGDTKKVFKTGWAFHYHLKYHHPNEQRNTEIITKVIDKVIQEKLK